MSMLSMPSSYSSVAVPSSTTRCPSAATYPPAAAFLRSGSVSSTHRTVMDSCIAAGSVDHRSTSARAPTSKSSAVNARGIPRRRRGKFPQSFYKVSTSHRPPLATTASLARDRSAARPALSSPPVCPLLRRYSLSWSAVSVSSLRYSAVASSAGRLDALSSPLGPCLPSPPLVPPPLAPPPASAPRLCSARPPSDPDVSAPVPPNAGSFGRAGALVPCADVVAAPSFCCCDAAPFPASVSLPRLWVSVRIRMFVLSVVMYWCAGGAVLWSHTYALSSADAGR
mmetsp:Transcript_6564/g.28636  ORF Transcript_6564/g.28636 Transcript_6564/m.28636 type:complete len:282 (-) Transcript_6564:168-1013(-)